MEPLEIKIQTKQVTDIWLYVQSEQRPQTCWICA
jgi:hypothetical protein